MKKKKSKNEERDGRANYRRCKSRGNLTIPPVFPTQTMQISDSRSISNVFPPVTQPRRLAIHQDAVPFLYGILCTAGAANNASKSTPRATPTPPPLALLPIPFYLDF
ncbi:hypothetical protein CDAR_398431 [Caerostris darwini]|uniref:Uncharacterized protein n=1 Tax=Caerostris darwini TaxID=1538125 RepID=A0AAV4VEV3_9ARAC|nr:hypothetical protein CDAR_398431 [Caerostris darwini]